jgi:hypothetical protein
MKLLEQKQDTILKEHNFNDLIACLYLNYNIIIRFNNKKKVKINLKELI